MNKCARFLDAFNQNVCKTCIKTTNQSAIVRNKQNSFVNSNERGDKKSITKYIVHAEVVVTRLQCAVWWKR